ADAPHEAAPEGEKSFHPPGETESCSRTCKKARFISLLKNAICGVALHFSSVRRTISTPYSSKFARLASHRF
ncbi:MAG: hypothetical protein ACLFOY_08270, partial [Desulfatibacillaceae bacterium]